MYTKHTVEKVGETTHLAKLVEIDKNSYSMEVTQLPVMSFDVTDSIKSNFIKRKK